MSRDPQDEIDSDEDLWTKPFPCITMSHNIGNNDFDISDSRNQLISQKWLLSNLIKVREFELKNLIRETKRELQILGILENKQRTYLDTLLENKSSRVSSLSSNSLSIRKGICCFENDSLRCTKPSIPFARHCSQHILYNVDQLLFVRCSAKDSDTLTQCFNPVLDVMIDEPLCNLHWQLREREERELAEKGKGKTKPCRPGRRSKKRRRCGKGSVDSMDSSSFLSQDSSDATIINDGEVKPLNDVESKGGKSIPSSLGQVFETIPMVSNSGALQTIAPDRVIPAALDVGVPNLAPSDEALVASLVADLPPLCTETGPEPEPTTFDPDLTDMLTKIPDDAFNDLFVDNLKNGDIPSKEEAEALEQALAAASKNVHILSVAAAVVSSRAGQSSSNSINGETFYPNGADRQGVGTPLNMNENDILGLASNIFGSLTTEQQQQLNGLIDGALASGNLTSSPTLKTALASLSSMPPGEHSDL